MHSTPGADGVHPQLTWSHAFVRGHGWCPSRDVKADCLVRGSTRTVSDKEEAHSSVRLCRTEHDILPALSFLARSCLNMLLSAEQLLLAALSVVGHGTRRCPASPLNRVAPPLIRSSPYVSGRATSTYLHQIGARSQNPQRRVCRVHLELAWLGRPPKLAHRHDRSRAVQPIPRFSC